MLGGSCYNYSFFVLSPLSSITITPRFSRSLTQRCIVPRIHSKIPSYRHLVRRLSSLPSPLTYVMYCPPLSPAHFDAHNQPNPPPFLLTLNSHSPRNTSYPRSQQNTFTHPTRHDHAISTAPTQHTHPCSTAYPQPQHIIVTLPTRHIRCPNTSYSPPDTSHPLPQQIIFTLPTRHILCPNTSY